MVSPSSVRLGRAVLLAALLAGVPARALISLEAGKDQLFVTTTLAAGYDSNLFANANGSGDSFSSLDVTAEFLRHAGLIALDATLSVDASRYNRLHAEDFQNPSLHATFTKATGRTTGALSVGVSRQSRADTAANLRDASWLYETSLALKYPVIERYSLSASAGYQLRDFIDNSTLVDLSTYSAGTDLFYHYSSDRDLLAGYHFSEDETAARSRNFDHALTVGVSGRLLASIKGQLRAGYEIRVPAAGPDGTFSAWTADGSAVWTITKRWHFTGRVSRDFSTTSTNLSVNTLAAGVDAEYAFNAKTALFTGMSGSGTDYLGQAGANRHDTAWTWNLGINRTLTDHVKLTVDKVFSQTWSTLAFSDYIRRSVSASLVARF